ncbi:MAG: phosphopyruvate hydratase, partial [Candidatus Thorarchaeota archaeon]
QVITDDLTVSNPEIVRRAIDEKAGNALLLKVNQIGSVTEAIEAANIANRAGWAVVVSHRSGETGDTFISDLSVALSNGQIKTGAPARSDRVEKYNRLLEIYDILDGECGYPGSDFRGAWGNY